MFYSAHKTRYELPNHNAPRKPPEQIEGVVIGERRNELMDVAKVAANLRACLGQTRNAHAALSP